MKRNIELLNKSYIAKILVKAAVAMAVLCTITGCKKSDESDTKPLNIPITVEHREGAGLQIADDQPMELDIMPADDYAGNVTETEIVGDAATHIAGGDENKADNAGNSDNSGGVVSPGNADASSQVVIPPSAPAETVILGGSSQSSSGTGSETPSSGNSGSTGGNSGGGNSGSDILRPVIDDDSQKPSSGGEPTYYYDASEGKVFETEPIPLN